MVRIAYLIILPMILLSCDRGGDLLVELHIDGSRADGARFRSSEQAAVWVGAACEPLWHTARQRGDSPTFRVVASGRNLAGVVESPEFAFEARDDAGMKLVQIDGESARDPKIEGRNLEWHSAQRYIVEEIMMVRMFGHHNQQK